jgi:hypothetical protein
MVEKELDAFIERRARKGETDPDERERQGILWEKLRYHEALVRAHSATFELLIGRHKSEVERLERLLGINDSEAQKVEAA